MYAFKFALVFLLLIFNAPKFDKLFTQSYESCSILQFIIKGNNILNFVKYMRILVFSHIYNLLILDVICKKSQFRKHYIFIFFKIFIGHAKIFTFIKYYFFNFIQSILVVFWSYNIISLSKVYNLVIYGIILKVLTQ